MVSSERSGKFSVRITLCVATRPRLARRASGSFAPGYDGAVLNWMADGRFEFRGSTFQMPPDDILQEGFELRDGDFWLFKSRSLIERYIALLEELRPRSVFELGVMGGGSTLFLTQFARLQRM